MQEQLDNLKNFIHPYWQGLNKRERLSVIFCGVSIVLFLIYAGLFRPLSIAIENSRSALKIEQERYKHITSLLAQQNTGQQNDTADFSQVRRELTDTAMSRGIKINRIQPNGDTALTVFIGSISAAVFFNWLTVLDSEHGIQPFDLFLQKNPDGKTLNVQTVFKSK